MRVPFFFFAVLVATLPGIAMAQSDLETADRWTFALEPLLFESEADEAEQRSEVHGAAAAATTLASELVDGGGLLAAIEAQDRMRLLFRRHDLYLFLKYAVDTRRGDALASADEMRVAVRAARQTLASALSAKSEGWIAEAIASEPALERYRYFIASVRSDEATTRVEGVERAIGEFAPLLDAREYPRIVSSLEFPPVVVDGVSIDYADNRADIEGSDDPEVRLAGERSLFQGYATRRDLLAHLLTDAIGGANAEAKLRNQTDAVQAALSRAELTEPDYRRLLSDVAAHADTFKTWQRRTEDPFGSQVKWTTEQAVQAVVESAAAFDDGYGDAFGRLLDPASGRADLGGTGPRLPIPGAASVYPIGTSTIYMRGFDGSLLDLIILAHEGGHAVQAQLMAQYGVRMANSTGPGYFTESFGRFQELILLDHMVRQSSDPDRRTLLRDALAARLMSVFRSAEEAAVELAIHDLVNRGGTVDADALDRVTLEVGSRYVLDYDDVPERAGLWMLSQGYFMAPMQELNDAWASLLAIRYFVAWREDPDGFRRAYLDLLSRGYDAAPDELLETLEIDIHDEAFVDDTLRSMDRIVSEIYAK